MSRIHPALKEIIDEDRKYDPWGAAMSAHFGIATVLDAIGNVPSEWQYRAPMARMADDLYEIADGEDYPDCDIARMMLYPTTELVPGIPAPTADDLEYAGNVLHRYTNLLDLHGKSY